MAQIPRPPKQGAVMTYVAKVAAGYPHILAGEMDADLDTIYGAWNSGADTVNIRDGAVTSAKLAADSVGPREMQDSGVGTSNLADASVTTPKIADGAVTAGKLAPGAVIFPPPATNSVGAAQIIDGSVGTAELVDGAVTVNKMAANAITPAAIADGAVTNAKLAPGALVGPNATFVTITSFSTTTIGSYVRVATLPALTTRGPNPVILFANHGLGIAIGTGVTNVMIRWIRDGTHLCNTAWGPGGGTNIVVPIPSLPWLDVVPAAGSYVYALEVQVTNGTATVYFVAGTTGCGLVARELG